MERAITIKRTYNPKETLGDLLVHDGPLNSNWKQLWINMQSGLLGATVYTCHSIELPNLENQHGISCIPEGIYPVTKIISPTKGPCFLLHSVPGRDAIEIHIGNFATGKKVDTLGCILPGTAFADLNGDGNLDVIHSTEAMGILLKIMPDQFLLTITS